MRWSKREKKKNTNADSGKSEAAKHILHKIGIQNSESKLIGIDIAHTYIIYIIRVELV